MDKQPETNMLPHFHQVGGIKILFYDEEKMVLDCSVQNENPMFLNCQVSEARETNLGDTDSQTFSCQNSMIFHYFSHSMIFSCMEFFSAIFHIFQSLLEPCCDGKVGRWS